MTQERIQYFENLLKKPMAEPHRGYIEELLAEVKGKTEPRKSKGYQVPNAPLIESPE